MTPNKFYKAINFCNIIKENFKFLELGTSNGEAYSSLDFYEKYTVDLKIPDIIEKNNGRSFEMSTDEFFNGFNPGKFDLIFIDANHDAPQVLKDYNSSLRMLKEGGIIAIHDCYPPSEEYCSTRFCSDSYKILYSLVSLGHEVLYTKEDFGLTIVFNPMILKVSEVDFKLSYQDFLKKIETFKKNCVEYSDLLYLMVKKVKKNEK